MLHKYIFSLFISKILGDKLIYHIPFIYLSDCLFLCTTFTESYSHDVLLNLPFQWRIQGESSGWNTPFFWTINSFEWGHIVGTPSFVLGLEPPLFKNGMIRTCISFLYLNDILEFLLANYGFFKGGSIFFWSFKYHQFSTFQLSSHLVPNPPPWEWQLNVRLRVGFVQECKYYHRSKSVWKCYLNIVI